MLGFLFLFIFRFTLIPLAFGLTAWNISQSEFDRMLWMSTIVIGDWLYIDDGEYYLTDTTGTSLYRSNSTLSIDLSTSWTTSSMTINSFDKPSSLLPIRQGDLWWNQNTSRVMLVGGEPYSLTPLYIWTLSVDGNGGGSWTETYGPGDRIWNTLVRPEYGLATASSTMGFILGGIITDFPNGTLSSIPGMVINDFATNSWTNLTTAGIYSESGMAMHGGATFVPRFGTAGLVMFIGGSMLSSSTDTKGQLKSMSNITIFDPYFQNWYSQTATGDVPSSRRDFCIVGAQSTNESTYEIFLYGGWNGGFSSSENTDSKDVYILSIPAFTWIRVTGSAPSRAGSSCQVIGNRQMLSFGGWDPTSSNEESPQDPWTYGIGIFDMTELSWSSNYNASAASYVRSDAVNSYYAKNSFYPNSWDDSALENLFVESANKTSAPVTTSTSLPLNPTSSTTKKSNSIPAIVGGVVGSICAMASLLTGLWYLYLRRRRTAPEYTGGSQEKYLPELMGNYGGGLSEADGTPTTGELQGTSILRELQ